MKRSKRCWFVSRIEFLQWPLAVGLACGASLAAAAPVNWSCAAAPSPPDAVTLYVDPAWGSDVYPMPGRIEFPKWLPNDCKGGNGPCQSISYAQGKCGGGSCTIAFPMQSIQLSDTIVVGPNQRFVGGCANPGEADPLYFTVFLAPAGGKPAFSFPWTPGAGKRALHAIQAVGSQPTSPSAAPAIVVGSQPGVKPGANDVVTLQNVQIVAANGANSGASGTAQGAGGGLCAAPGNPAPASFGMWQATGWVSSTGGDGAQAQSCNYPSYYGIGGALGGPSIGLAIIEGAVAVRDSVIAYSGRGGRGGAGGSVTIATECAGLGGAGAGGPGGPSIPVALVGSGAITPEAGGTLALAPALGGVGGAGGAGGIQYAHGSGDLRPPHGEQCRTSGAPSGVAGIAASMPATIPVESMRTAQKAY